ncbi:MAG: flagellar basal body P-ring formation protein FlgA [Halanaerobiales bacterium]|nr:flagellar basal body P-ring formation protein FlgA [Halanaerobiales bacterium]
MISYKRRSVVVMQILVLFLIFFSIVCVPVDAAEKVKIIFNPEVIISEERMLLDHLAEIDGEGPTVERLRTIDFGPAPSPGKYYTLSQGSIHAVLRQMKIDLEQIEIINLTSTGIIVQRVGVLLEEEKVLSTIYDYISSKLPYYVENVEINLRHFPEIWVPSYDIRLEVRRYTNNRNWGFMSLPMTVFINDKEYTRFTISLDVRIFGTVFVASQPIDRLEIITQDMVEEKYLDITRLNGEPVFELKDVVDKQAKRSFRLDTVLINNYLIEPKLVHRNDQVTIEVWAGAIHVQTFGKALSDGARDQWIWIENLSSGKKIQARVIDIGLVRVELN